MKKILVPTDFSDNARNALRYAIQLAQLFNSQIILLHTFSTSSRADMLVSMEKIMRKDAENEMELLTKEIPDDVRWKSEIQQGETIHNIAVYAERNEIDLIVMGTKGASGLEKVFIGSVTGGVMRQTSTPLLAIPKDYAYQPLEKIVLAIASLQLADPEKVVAPLKALAKKYKATVLIYHHDESNSEVPDEVMGAVEWLEGIPVNITFDQDDDHINESISEFVTDSGADLLCMVRRKRKTIGFFERLFQESSTLTQVFHTEVPLLIMHSDQ